MSPKILIRGGCVLTLGTRTSNHPQADVLIADGRIAEVGSGIRTRDAEVVDASDAIVMPGFVDAHRHLAGSLFRNLGLPDFRVDGEHFQPEDVYAATLVGLLAAAEAGVTTVVDWCEVALDPERRDAAIQAHSDSGLRTVLVLAHPPGLASGTWEKMLGSPPAGEAGLAAGSDEPGRVPDPELEGQWAIARELGLRVHAHAGTGQSEDAIARLGRAGALGPDVTLVHCTQLSDEDFDAIASAGTSVVLAPSEEMACGMGTPPVQRLMDREVRAGLGVGRDAVAPGDVFAQMRAVISIQHASYFDLKLAGKAGLPNLLNTRETIKHGTVHGARAVGLGDLTGSIEVGKAADVIVLRTDRPNIWPVNDPIGAVVWGMDTSNLDWVFVGGRAVMRGGDLTGDVATARRLAVEAQTRVAERAGLLEHVEGSG